MLFERLVTGKADRVQVIPAGVGANTLEGMLCLRSWLNGVQATLPVDVRDAYPWQTKVAQLALHQYGSDTSTYDVRYHLQQYLPTGFTCVQAFDGVWVVPVDDWTPVALCAAQMVYWQTNALRPEWSDLVRKVKALDGEVKDMTRTTVMPTVPDMVVSVS